MTVQKNVLVIGGPTASGKSGLALSLAEKLSGIVINADSMQVYKGLPILTAQPSEADKKKVPHRLYGALAPEKNCSAVIWRDMALAEIRAAHKDGKLPVIVGGTGFYLGTLIKGVSPIPDVPPGVRKRLSSLQKEMGNPAFHHAFAACDPVMAAKLDPFNTQRVIRAWEVLEATGKSLAEWQKAPPVAAPGDLRFSIITLLPPRDVLYKSCNARLEQMISSGAFDEVREFKKICLPGMALAKALGYPELAAHIDGKMSLAEAIESAQASTRHYAKRQVTWFRRQIAADLVLEDASHGEKLVLEILKS